VSRRICLPIHQAFAMPHTRINNSYSRQLCI